MELSIKNKTGYLIRMRMHCTSYLLTAGVFVFCCRCIGDHTTEPPALAPLTSEQPSTPASPIAGSEEEEEFLLPPDSAISHTDIPTEAENVNAEIFEKDGMIKYCPPIDHCNDYMIIFEINQFEKYYKPDRLSNDFKIDGLRVKVTYRISEEKHNCGFGGYVPVIEILKIRRK
jgi:hypothetical protein